MKYLYLITLLCFTMFSCTSVPRLLEKGDYGKAYAKAYRACTRVPAHRRKLKHIDNFVSAYAAIQAKDQARAKNFQRLTGTGKWPKLYEVYADLYDRSEDILYIAPAAARFERYPGLAPAYLEQRREEARKKAGDHYLTLTEILLPAARTGEKPAAREAFRFHERIGYFLPERDTEFAPLRDSLRDIGTLRVLLYAPGGDFARELDDATHRLNPFERNWTTILPYETGQRIDLEAELTFSHYDDRGVSENCSTREYEEEVLDRIEKKKIKERINDSTVVEKIIEIKHYKKVYAQVTECDQNAAVYAYGHLNVFRPEAGQPEWRTELSAWETWSNSYRFGSGDSRALPAFANSGSPQSPPRLGYMLGRAVRRMPNQARGHLIKRYAPKLREKQRSVTSF
jgi:hypothetical protein